MASHQCFTWSWSSDCSLSIVVQVGSFGVYSEFQVLSRKPFIVPLAQFVPSWLDYHPGGCWHRIVPRLVQCRRFRTSHQSWPSSSRPRMHLWTVLSVKSVTVHSHSSGRGQWRCQQRRWCGKEGQKPVSRPSGRACWSALSCLPPQWSSSCSGCRAKFCGSGRNTGQSSPQDGLRGKTLVAASSMSQSMELVE